MYDTNRKGSTWRDPDAAPQFTEANGKTAASIRYEEHPESQALEVLFTDGALFSFELSSRPDRFAELNAPIGLP